ncbi:MAG: hypothetical protein CMK56_04830 [Proteobacteria bacterium]|nr:hypothetical protein [Pseudomonadota bacterium]
MTIDENSTKLRTWKLKHITCFLFYTIAMNAYGSSRENLPYFECFEKVAKKYRLDPEWLTAISIVESSLNPKAISKSNALGLMQIKWPLTAKHLGAISRESLFQPCFNIELGGKYLRELLDRHENDKDLAASAYRVGPTRLSQSKTIPGVALEYLDRIKDQVDIFAASTRKMLPPGQGEGAIEPSATENKTVLSKPTLKRLPDKTTPIEILPLIQPKKIAQPECKLGVLQVNTLSTHDPVTRERNFLSWLEKNAVACDLKQLTSVFNQIPVWLGTSDTKKVRDKLAILLQKK